MNGRDGRSTRFGLAGHGVTGGGIARRLLAAGAELVVHDPDAAALGRAQAAGAIMAGTAGVLAGAGVVVLCGPSPHAPRAASLLSAGTSVVSVADDLDDVRELLGLDVLARRVDATLLVGAAMAPGLSGLLARSLATQVHQVDELHVATHGTAGPACARQHHDSLGRTALGWHDGRWIEPPGGSGRDLVWFPEPIGAHDCYRAAVADPLLLHRAFPGVQRITARVSATRRDRLTARLPMLTPPHPAGDLGAVRVEARGAGPEGERVTVIAGASGPTAELAAAVAAAAALRLAEVGAPAGAHSLADDAVTHLDLLHHATHLGVTVQEFTGVARATHW
ncbi:MAG: NAD(P)-binding domain-containing protein [Acidimicrobiaceae bacterium]|nr:NAD(P)-binding domain-containing protein [Ilumatobacter sp.]MCB9381828.1 NAD(P)-binding domain-containing protein [Acidimicrobiaceae bacterium]